MSLSNRVAFKNYEVIHLSWYCSSARNTQHAVQINEKHNLAAKNENNPAAAMSLSNRVAFKNYEVIHLSWYCSSARNTQHAVQINEKHNLAVVVVCLLHRSVPVVFYLPAPNFESVPSWKKRKLAAEVSSTGSLLPRCFSSSTMSLWNDISSQKSAQKISEQDRIQIFLKVNSFQLC